MRLGYHGLWQTPKLAFYGAQNANNNPAGVAPANNGAANDKFGFHYLYGALMWNISNRDETSASFVPDCDKYTGGYDDSEIREPALWYRGVLCKLAQNS